MIATQTAVGDTGRKATTEISDSYKSIVNSKFLYGLGSNGIELLNSGTVVSSFTLATTDFGVDNPKKLRYLYFGFEASLPFTVTVTFDDKSAKTYTVTPLTTGLQRKRIPIGSSIQGRYCTITVTATSDLRIDNIKTLYQTRSSGIGGY